MITKSWLIAQEVPLCEDCRRIYKIWESAKGCSICNKGFLQGEACPCCETGRKVRAIYRCCYSYSECVL